MQWTVMAAKTITSGMPSWQASKRFPPGTLCKSCYPSRHFRFCARKQTVFPGLPEERRLDYKVLNVFYNWISNNTIWIIIQGEIIFTDSFNGFLPALN